MDSLMGLIDWVLTLILWVGIPVSMTLTFVYTYFQTIKPDDGKVAKAGGGGGGRGGGDDSLTVSDFIKQCVKIFVIGVICWVLIYVIRNVLPAAGSAVAGSLGF